VGECEVHEMKNIARRRSILLRQAGGFLEGAPNWVRLNAHIALFAETAQGTHISALKRVTNSAKCHGITPFLALEVRK